jgi:heme/copper-type cytochrome/quinol oxidase subunit 4
MKKKQRLYDDDERFHLYYDNKEESVMQVFKLVAVGGAILTAWFVVACLWVMFFG